MASFAKKATMASFSKLLEEKPLSQITIREIVEYCGINRNTFYYHFRDRVHQMPAVWICDALDGIRHG